MRLRDLKRIINGEFDGGVCNANVRATTTKRGDLTVQVGKQTLRFKAGRRWSLDEIGDRFSTLKKVRVGLPTGMRLTIGNRDVEFANNGEVLGSGTSFL